MITCPNYGELFGNTANECFKCGYHFFKKSFKHRRSNITKRQTNKRTKKKEETKQKETDKQKQLSKNPIFEYKSIVVNDLSNGEIDEVKTQNILNEWAEKGWRLHSVFCSEIGTTLLVFQLQVQGV